MARPAGVLMCLMFISLSAARAEFPKSGEWPNYRRDKGLTARSPGVGAIRNPDYKALHFVGAHDQFLILKASDASTETVRIESLPASGEKLDDPRFGLVPPVPAGEMLGAMAGGNEDMYANVLPDEPYMQWIDCESGFSLPTINGDWQPARVRCKKWVEGAWQVAWETEPWELLFNSNVIAGDFDNDGVTEVAFLPWRQLVILDGRNGATESQCAFTEGRSYGYFSAYDLDRDGKKEFIVLADFAKHIDVLGYDADGKMSLKWQRNIELTLENPQSQMRVNPYCVADVTGDEKLEIIVSLHNPPAAAGAAVAGDNQWHVMVYDGMTGHVQADYANESLAGVVDLDGDGDCEILTQSSALQNMSDYGTLRARDVRAGAVVWSKSGAAWQMYNPAIKLSLGHGIFGQERLVSGSGGNPQTGWTREAAEWARWRPDLPAFVHSEAALANLNILQRSVGGKTGVVIRRPCPANPDDVQLTLVTWEGNGFKPGRSIAGRHLVAVAIAGNGNLLVRQTSPDSAAAVTLYQSAGEKLFSQMRGVDVSGGATVTAAWDDGSSQPTLLATGAAEEEEVVAFRPPSVPGGKSTELWRQSGRAEGENWSNNYGPVLSDLDDDGRRELIYATTSAESACGRLAVRRLSGGEAWHHDFLSIPGKAPFWNTGGVIHWRTGNFRDPKVRDVLVTVRRNIMHSDETYLLSGADGREIWRRESAGLHGRGVGGQPFAIADYDGDGLDEPASFYPDLFYILNGASGANLIMTTVKSLAGHPPEAEGYWGAPLAGDFLNNGVATVFHATGRASLTGVVAPDFPNHSGRFVWAAGAGVSPTSLPAIGDVDGDGRLDAVGVGFADGIRCYDTASGALKWTLPSPGTPNGAAAGDIDGDGDDEAIFSIGSTLNCYGDGKCEWTLSLPAYLGAPSLADVYGTGKISILAPGSDGWVYVVDEKGGG